MGWYGDYLSVNHVMAEKEQEIEWTDRLQVIDTKETKTYGIILYRDTWQNNEHFIESFIFRDGMYKPINFVDDFLVHFKRIPKKWHKALSMNKEQKEIIDRQNELVKQEKHESKVAKEKLEQLLVKGQIYSIWNGQFEAEYHGKIKRSHIFKVGDQLTRFRKLKPTDLELVK